MGGAEQRADGAAQLELPGAGVGVEAEGLAQYQQRNLALFGKLWWRIPEDEDKDDNPDITDYYGYGSLSALYRWRGHSFVASTRGNINKTLTVG